jgi:drug/metabolite transporter (DMT)-like permease
MDSADPAPPVAPALPERRLGAAVLWMLGALASFVGMALGIRSVGDTLGTFEILTFRSLVGLLMVAAVVAWRGRAGPRLLATRQPRRQLTRNLVHFGGQYAWTYGLTVLPLSVVTALEYTNPIWAGLLAVVMLGERLTAGRLVALVAGLVGVVVILRPGMAAIDPSSLIVLAAAALYAYAHIAGKILVRTDTPLAVVFYMATIQLPLSAVPAAFQWVGPAPGDYPWLLVIGVGGMAAHYCLSEAFKRADAITVAPVDFLRLPILMTVGIALFGEPFDPFILVGGAIVCAGVWWNLRQEMRARRAGEPVAAVGAAG